ncbi:MOSC domain-containing protein [Agrobacterium vitis]|uniref:MOSC domain-containing protein n=1 Tax=Agrobacterium vitis TaxID=373 RepID=UPI000872C57B|nr:MOSC domain-containing protein [Agrobacterium vitis]MCE6073474.1 MOSC domain-containing protein [Agrobacterium vitis]MCM2452700.1 MOSC domain-containing protein [Agrobacterium vitis]MCM2469405.1 MOSC domain-containing protein [Agrobacterium vitis]MUO69122.1 MOSC domain-containing protein [Agrobacterium vitis]MUO83672.1 MOSC domain-containing protein [Agrobacterium vitis]
MMKVEAVSLSKDHLFSKQGRDEIVLLAGLGVEGDAHLGVTVQHRSRVAANPSQPNLRQVHLIHAELFDELGDKGFSVTPGDLGENITTRGVDLLALPQGSRLQFESGAVVEVTGLRNPCKQINDFQPGLMQAVLERDPDGGLIRKAGVMAVVIEGGVIHPGDRIRVEQPGPPHRRLQPV